VDLDNDGWLDPHHGHGHVYPQVDSLPSAGGYRQPKLVHFNQKDGTSATPANSQARPCSKSACRAAWRSAISSTTKHGSCVGDLVGSPMLLKNSGVENRHWVSFELAGTKSNRLAIGARLKVIAGGVTQTEEIHSGGSYLSQNDLRVSLRPCDLAPKVDSVEIRWPSGATDVLKDLGADKYYAVLEGKRRCAFRRNPALPAETAANPEEGARNLRSEFQASGVFRKPVPRVGRDSTARLASQSGNRYPAFSSQR